MYTKQFTAIKCDNRCPRCRYNVYILQQLYYTYTIPIQNSRYVPINLQHYHGELVTGSMAKTLR